MACCEYCGAEIVGRTRRARFCSDKHRVYFKRQQDRQLTAAQLSMVAGLRAVKPMATKRLEDLLPRVEPGCRDDLIRACVWFTGEAEKEAHRKN